MVIDQPERAKSKAEFWRTRPLSVPFPPPGNSKTYPLQESAAFGAAEIKCLAFHGHGLRRERVYPQKVIVEPATGMSFSQVAHFAL